MSGSGPQSALNSLLRVIISVIINKAIFKCNNDGLLNILFRILNALRQVTNVSNDDASVACHFVWFGRPRPYIHSITEWLICVILYGYYFNDNFGSRGGGGGGSKGIFAMRYVEKNQAFCYAGFCYLWKSTAVHLEFRKSRIKSDQSSRCSS